MLIGIHIFILLILLEIEIKGMVKIFFSIPMCFAKKTLKDWVQKSLQKFKKASGAFLAVPKKFWCW